MAAKQFGGNVPVDFTSVLKTIETKLGGELKDLHGMLSSSEGLHDFEAFNAKTQEMQASVRTIDLLQGKVADIYGNSHPIKSTEPPADDDHGTAALTEALANVLDPKDYTSTAARSAIGDQANEEAA